MTTLVTVTDNLTGGDCSSCGSRYLIERTETTEGPANALGRVERTTHRVTFCSDCGADQ